MKSKGLSMLMLAMILVFATNAHATHPDTLNMNADCYGWSIVGHFYMGDAEYVNVEYTVELVQDMTPVCTINEVLVLYPGEESFNFSGGWCEELCGDYTVNIHLFFQSNSGWGNRYYDTSFYCECDEPGDCTYTPGYWKNHPEAWPVMELEVGGITYTQMQLLDIFDMPTKGDITIILFHHLVAAKLNLLSGGPDYIMGAVAEGDAYLMMYPLGSKPVGEAKDEGEAIKDELVEYNEIPCDDEMEVDMISLPKVPSLAPIQSPDNSKSWGAIKSKGRE